MSAIHTVLKRLVKQNEATVAVGAHIEHLLDGTVDWLGELRKSPRRSARGRRE